MPATPTNCFICKNTWRGVGPICDVCRGIIHPPPPQLPTCSFCGGNHNEAACSAAALAAQQLKQQLFNSTYMAQRFIRRSKPFTNYYNGTSSSPLKFCGKCKQNTCVKTKAGSICTNGACKTLIRNPCRNCDSTSTHGLSGDGLQFIECNDCRFIE